MKNGKSWGLLAIVLLAVIAAGYVMFMAPQTDATAKSNVYQAVFLVNNQVYFGKLMNQNSQFATLKDIYYLQVNQTIQPVQAPAKGQPAPQANPAINLVKLGAELHGPTDEMRINRDQILLVEDLRTDSNLVKAIEDYKARQAAPATQ